MRVYPIRLALFAGIQYVRAFNTEVGHAHDDELHVPMTEKQQLQQQ